VQPDFRLQPNAFEVADTFEVPLAFLMDPANHHRHAFEWEGGASRMVLHALSRKLWVTRSGERFIWGATAGMLRNFYRFSFSLRRTGHRGISPAGARYDAPMSFFAISVCAVVGASSAAATRQSGACGRCAVGLAGATGISMRAGRITDGSSGASRWDCPRFLRFAIHVLLSDLLGWPFAAIWSAALLYVTVGFRQFSHHFTDIRDALGRRRRGSRTRNFWRNGARRIFVNCRVANWFVVSSNTRCCRRTATFSGFWPGIRCWPRSDWGQPALFLYRSSEFVSRYWRYQGTVAQQPVSEAVQAAAAEAWRVIDWFPARITALGFASRWQF
jgi:hypothetical protein